MKNNSIINPSESLVYKAHTSIFQSFIEQSLQIPDATALVSNYGKCSYAELEEISRKIAICLLSHGVHAQDRVVILSDRDPALVYAILGVLRAGAAFNIADVAYPTVRILVNLHLVQPRILLVCGDIAIPVELQNACNGEKNITILKIPSVFTDASAMFSQFDINDFNVTAAIEETAYITFTSGSTGHPKAITTTHAPLPHFIDWHVSQHELTAKDRFSMLSGLSHDPLLRDVFTPLSIGSTLCIPKQATIFDPEKLFDWLSEQGITACHLTPALGDIIIAGADDGMQVLPKLRYLFWGGDVLSLKSSQRLREAAPKAIQVNFYGATETPQAMAYFTIDPTAKIDAFPIGRGIANAQLLLITESQNLAQAGELGEIWIRSPYLSQGYLNDIEQTHTRFIKNPLSKIDGDLCYRTGDLGKYLPDGNVMFIGRMDHQVKIRGFRVEPAEVASNIERFSGISRAIVLAMDNGPDRKILVAYVTVILGHSVENALLLKFLRENLSSYMIPSSIVQMERFPLLPNGKIDLQSLPSPSQKDAPGSKDYSAPINEREAELIKIWQDILGINKIGVNDNFLVLGGDSLSALRALVRMKKLGIATDVAKGIFQGKTIKEIIGNERGKADESKSLAAELRTNLLINIVRGILLALVITDHWFEGLMNHLAGKGNGEFLLKIVSPLFNIATPGFAFVFGAGLGYLSYSKHKVNPAQTREAMRFGTFLLLTGTFAGAVMNLAPLRWDNIDSTIFFNAFFSPLLYYALALITATLWFTMIAKTRHEYLACIGLIVFSYLMFRGCEWLLLSHEQIGFFQLVRLMLVAKFNYFNMAVGTLGGVMAGIYLKQHYKDDLSWRCFWFGGACMGAGLALLYVGSGSLLGLYDSTNMDLWRWPFYSGLVLILAGGVGRILQNFSRLPKGVRTGLQMCAVLGQGTFPVFVLHGLVLRGKLLLLIYGLSMTTALSIPFAFFFAFSGWMLIRLYQLYYSTVTN